MSERPPYDDDALRGVKRRLGGRPEQFTRIGNARSASNTNASYAGSTTAPGKRSRPNNRYATRQRRPRLRRIEGLRLVRHHSQGWWNGFKTWFASVDKPLVLITLTLAFYGLVVLYSASAPDGMQLEKPNQYIHVSKQAFFMLLGAGILYWTSCRPMVFWRRLAPGLMVVCIALLLLTQLIGTVSYGAERWLSIGGITIQPSELAKIAVILMLAKALASAPKQGLLNKLTHLAPSLLVLAAVLGLILKQPNLSMTLILSTTAGLMLFMSGLSHWLFTLSLPVFGAGVVYVIQHNAYQMKRITGWLNPWEDELGTGFNLIRSWYAIASGGVFGQGYGKSIEKLFYLPVPYIDFIFSVLCEELGLVGAVGIISVFIMMVYRGFTIAWQARDSFSQYVAFGLTCTLVIQTLVNLYVTTGLFPVTGVTLPLVSYGGTSVMITLAIIGILLGISRQTKRQKQRDFLEPAS